MKLFTKILIWNFCIFQISVNAQNYVNIAPGATSSEVLLAALQVRPSERQLAWQSLEYYAFIHFGPNTFLGKEWGDGTADPSVFNPTELDANQWVKTIKAAGMKGLILTAKHHDGFCLWPTNTTPYSVSASPWRNGKGDLVREVADACHKEGIKLGIYLSPWDRNHPTYGDSPAYNKVFISQLTELLSNYGELFEVWFDGANGEGPNGKVQQYDWESNYNLVRKLQPNAVIAVMGPDVRWCGNEAGKGRDPEWSVLPVTATSQNVIAENSQQKVGTGMFVPKNAKGSDLGSRELLLNSPALIWYPSEVDTSIRPGWFYHAEQDDKVKTPEKLEQIYYSSIGMNASFLLNIPPDKRGLIHENDIKNLMLFKERMSNTFKNNLAFLAKFSSKESNRKTSLKLLTDGNNRTYWTTKKGQTTAAIEMKFEKPQVFDRLLLQENIQEGQRVESFALEIFENDKWTQIAEGKTIGYKRILCFKKATAQKVRILITASRSNPQLSEIGIFNSPQ
jgi:alpha-L-fucosidase